VVRYNGVTPEGLALQVADGEPADWQEALDSTDDDRARRVIESLRLLENVARVHRGETPDRGASPEAGSVDAEHPATWGHLEIRESLGAGGFGEVYRAWDPHLDHEVALKLIEADDPGETTATSKAVAEGRLLAKVRHPNVVTVHGADTRDGQVGIWMELVRGRSLEQLLREQGPFGASETALIGIDVCRALAAVHRVGVVHRDIKAQNIMRAEGGRILLTDFGAGLDLRQESGGRKVVTGTPLYMAPELFRDEPASQRSDIYSLGVMLYHLVTGEFPVTGAAWDELYYRHGQKERKLLRDERPDLPEGFVSVVERAMAWEPSERFATAGQMEQALGHAIGVGNVPPAPDIPAPVPAAAKPSRRWVIAAVPVAAVTVAAIIGLWNAGRDSGTRTATVTTVPSGPAEPAAPPQAGPAPSSTDGAAAPAITKPAAPAAAAPFTVEAGVYRFPSGSDQRQLLESGARLALGDRLNLEFEASVPLHVYVINEDEAGHSYALFPLPGLDAQNPLPAGVRHVLPGTRDGRNLSWTVDSPGGREHVLVVASPTRLVEFEADMNGLARPGQIAVPIPESARMHLRGLGGLSEAPATAGRTTAAPLFERAQRLAARSEVTRGVWVRRLDLENPRP
jgi:serine/threonine-protein kinase